MEKKSFFTRLEPWQQKCLMSEISFHCFFTVSVYHLVVWRCFWFSPQLLMLQQTWYFQFVSSTFRKARLCFVFIKKLYGETNLSHFSVEDRTPPGGTEPDLWLWSRPHHCWFLTRVEPLKAADRETTLGFGTDQHVNDAENVILIWQISHVVV